jgi:hypothetical protein
MTVVGAPGAAGALAAPDVVITACVDADTCEEAVRILTGAPPFGRVLAECLSIADEDAEQGRWTVQLAQALAAALIACGHPVRTFRLRRAMVADPALLHVVLSAVAVRGVETLCLDDADIRPVCLPALLHLLVTSTTLRVLRVECLHMCKLFDVATGEALGAALRACTTLFGFPLPLSPAPLTPCPRRRPCPWACSP